MSLELEIDVKHNLLNLLERKMMSLQLAARCHERLARRYAWRARVVSFLGLVAAGVSVAFSTIWGESAAATNLPLVIMTGITFVIKGSEQITNYRESARDHAQCHVQALDLADDIEYVILKNNHTEASLQQQIEVYEARIKSFRKSEAPVPVHMKLRALQSA